MNSVQIEHASPTPRRPSQILVTGRPGWPREVRGRLPGSHVALLSSDPDLALEGRRAGLERRDTLLVLRSGPQSTTIALFRVPPESTLVDQVAATGTGCMNLGACRVGAAGTDTAGRWPPNVLLIHGAGCHRVGSKLIRSSKPVMDRTRGAGFHQENKIFGTGEGEFESVGYGDADGMEAVAVYECVPACPVLLLEAQDAGASRYYPQFRDEPELLDWLERLLG